MYSILTTLANNYYKFWIWLASFKTKLVLLPVNFNKNWLHVIWLQKKYLIIAFINDSVINIFYTLIPILFGLILSEQKYLYYFPYLLIIWGVAIIINYISNYFTAILEIQCISSIQFHAYTYFLTVDPIFHTLRTTGKLFAKIERGARSYEEFLDISLFDLSPTIISITTVLGSFFWVDKYLGIVALSILVLIASLNIFLNIFTGKAFEGNLINADDNFKAITVEGLTQVQLIRSNFATNEITNKMLDMNQISLSTEATYWFASSTVLMLTRLAYLGSIIILGKLIIYDIENNIISSSMAITLLLTYIRGTHEIISIGRRLRKLIRTITRIYDLFGFIRGFGKQTFPVLLTDSSNNNRKNLNRLENILAAKHEPVINLVVRNLSFDYTPKAKIFEDHSLNLSIPRGQENKLYGIIGPSGMGKTTFLSILGGQFHPTKGTISINGINIYETDDIGRQQIIAMQGQMANSLSGSLKSSLLLGLPNENLYSDKELIKILQEVGIWNIFEEKEGLATYIGESGFTLSGGQRQRLNFASLYLRSNYYKPLLILIDEPTSSLDQISEIAVTNMIKQLAKDSLTIVIAHRIQTLEHAIGILDFSLLSTHKQIEFLTPQDLEKRSYYYKKLIQGTLNIEV